MVVGCHSLSNGAVGDGVGSCDGEAVGNNVVDGLRVGNDVTDGDCVGLDDGLWGLSVGATLGAGVG